MKKLFSVSIDCRIFLLYLFFYPFLIISAQEEKPQEMKQYLFPGFSEGTIKMSSGKPRKMNLNYNTVTEKVVFEQKGQYYDLIGQETIDTVYLQNRKFIPYEDFFLDVVYKGEKVAIGIQHRSNLQEPGKPAGYGTTSELSATTYLSGVKMNSHYYNLKLPEGFEVRYSTFYWVKKGDTWQKFLSVKQYIKIFPEYSDQLEQFVKKNKIKVNRRGDLEKLGGFSNSLLNN